MKYTIAFLFSLAYFTVFAQPREQHTKSSIIANGQMPNLTKENQNNLHLVYGAGDSILYTYSTDNGNTFVKPVLITVLPHVFTYATRGPQIAVNENGLIIIAPTSTGNIYTFYKNKGGSWTKGALVNDEAFSAKEGLTGLSADGKTAFAVWLDARGNGRNKIYGAKSTDGGKTWSTNRLVYASPDSSVCECCKPSVVVKGNHVYVMFRNWLHGSRDLYLAQSSDGGSHFNQVQKLGTGTWKLNACPMDGGGLTVDEKGIAQTVWRRENTIYSTMPGIPEQEIGQGKGCTIERVNNTNVYGWIDNGSIVILKRDGQKEILGEGKQPVIKAIDNQHVICIWENEKQLHASVIQL